MESVVSNIVIVDTYTQDKMAIKSKIEKNSPPIAYAGIATTYWILHPFRTPRVILPHENHWRVTNLWKRYSACVPNARQINRGSLKIRQRKMERYTYAEFVELDKNDVVLDVGAFVGEFTVPAADRVKRVISLEPDKKNFSCLKHNTYHLENVYTKKLLAWNKNGIVKLNLGKDSSDHSVFNVDSHQVRKSVSAKAARLDTFLSSLGVESVDFLKLDAEGAEPQVLQGMKDIEFEKCAVDCSAEYYGNTTKKSVISILKGRGYNIKKGKKSFPDVVYGRM